MDNTVPGERKKENEMKTTELMDALHLFFSSSLFNQSSSILIIFAHPSAESSGNDDVVSA
jgi:hypothetical protein